jgi:sulfur transfer complex TusBCD TusB component (DsrH family)
MKILHIMREKNDPLALQAVAAAGREGAVEVGILLLHDAVFSKLPDGLQVYACADDVAARGVEAVYDPVSYDQIIKLFFEYDSVITW